MKTPREIEGEALTWLLRRDAGTLTPADEAGFSQWYRADVRHEIAYLRIETVWNAADRLNTVRANPKGFVRSVSLEPQSRVRFRIAAAAAVLLTIGLAPLAGPLWSAATSKTYSTRPGEFERVVLRDGTTVDLNAGSDIRVRMSAEHREIRLLRGEAYFKVAHDPRPFDVDARGTVVRAIGTAFSVRLIGAGRVDVLVSEGLVAVRPRQLNLDLDAVAMPELPELVPRVAAGQAAVVDSKAVVVQPLPPERIEGRLAWIDGWLDMTDKTLDEVVAEFNRFNEQQIVIVDPRVGLIRKLGGRFRLSDPESFVATLVGRGEIRADARPAGLDGPAIIHLYDAGPGAFPGSPTD